MQILKNTIEVKDFEKEVVSSSLHRKEMFWNKKTKPQTWWEMYFVAEALCKKY